MERRHFDLFSFSVEDWLLEGIVVAVSLYSSVSNGGTAGVSSEKLFADGRRSRVGDATGLLFTSLLPCRDVSCMIYNKGSEAFENCINCKRKMEGKCE